MAATAIPRLQDGWIERLGQRCDEFWAATPGMRNAGRAQTVFAAIAYSLLMAVFVFLFVSAPVLGAASAFAFALVTGAWGAREVAAARLAPLRSGNAWVRRAGWIGTVLVLVVIGLPLATLASVALILTPLGVLAWWTIWREQVPLGRRMMRATSAALVAPVALVLWYLRRGSAWSRLLVSALLVLSIYPYAYFLLVWRVDGSFYGPGALSPLLVLLFAEVCFAAIFAASAAIRIADAACEADMARHPSSARSEGQSTVARRGPLENALADVGLLLPARLVLWALVEAVFVLPWVFLLSNLGREDGTDFEVLTYVFVAIVVLPIAVTAVVAVVQGSRDAGTAGAAAVERHLSSALASSLLLALGIAVTFATLTWSALTNSSEGFPYLAAMAILAGFNVGLSLRLGKLDPVRKYWTYAASAITTALVVVAVPLLMLLVDTQSLDATVVPAVPLPTPEQGSFVKDLLLTGRYPAAALAGLSVGLLISAALYPGLRSFAWAMHGFREMYKPLIGFVCGYVLIVLTFGAAYYAIYKGSSSTFDCPSADGTQIVACQAGKYEMRDFMFFSVNTSLPLGYSPIKPHDSRVQWLTAAEIWVATAWVVIVFAAMLHSIQTKMVRESIAKYQAAHMNGGPGGAGPPPVQASVRFIEKPPR